VLRARWVLAAIMAMALGMAPGGVGQAAISRGEGEQLARDHADWLLPAWTSGGPSAWTMVGLPYGSAVTLIGADGSFAPRNHGPSVSLWIFDRDAGTLLVPGPRDWRFHLDEDACRL
jgi:hypothetical protein